MSSPELALTVLQALLFAPLAVLGLHRGWIVHRARRARRRDAQQPRPGRPPARHRSDRDRPTVLVQLPIYNERFVAARLLDAIARLDHPRHRLRIQVLDDSTDDTPEIVAAALQRLPPDLAIEHVRRADRRGFKAGALQRGLATDDSEFVAIFDADFVPPADFLARSLAGFDDPGIGMVQARWGHLNEEHSLLTRVQALLLDGHFLLEHRARADAGCFFNFNGTAGVFRRSCIDDAGGWHGDTLTEDLDCSYRAQRRGWRFRYLPDLVCPAELPTDMPAFLTQQHRWAKGSIQVARKQLPAVLRAPLPRHVRSEAVFHLAGNVAFPMLLGVILIALPLQAIRLGAGTPLPTWLWIFEGLPLSLALLCVLTYYGVARGRLQPLLLPAVLALGAGMCVNQTRAVAGACGGDPGEFRRTPKYDVRGRRRATSSGGYRVTRGVQAWIELGLGGWAATTATLALLAANPATGLFHALFAAGLLWVGGASLRADVTGRRGGVESGTAPLPAGAARAAEVA